MLNRKLTNEESAYNGNIQILDATTEGEKEAIYKFRYQIQVAEMGRYHIPNTDHEGGRIIDGFDALSHLAYAEYNGKIIGTVRLTIGSLMDYPPELAKLFAFKDFAEYDLAGRICLGTKIMVDPLYRRTPVAFNLIARCYEILRQEKLQFSFSGCNPHLIPMYEQLGYRRFARGFQDPGYGYIIPIVLLPEDIEHLKVIRSPLLRLARRYENSPAARKWFLANFSQVNNYPVNLLVNEVDRWGYVTERLGDPLVVPLLHGLSQEEASKLLQAGIVIKLDGNEQFLQHGDFCNDAHILLAGDIAVSDEAGTITRLGPGDTIGSIGLLEQKNHPKGAKTLTPCEILSISRTPFEKLQKMLPGIEKKIRLNCEPEVSSEGVNIILVNGHAPRQRSISDAALENSMAILRTYLAKRGIGVKVIDNQRVSKMEAGIPRWCSILLRGITSIQLKFLNSKPITALLFLASWPFHSYSLYCRQRQMEESIETIIRELKLGKKPFLGIKLWYGDAYKWSSRLAAAVRKYCPETVVVVGGPVVKVYGELVLGESNFDLAIMGPGEEVLASLILSRKEESRKSFLANTRSVYGGSLIKTGGYCGDQKKVTADLAIQTIPRYTKEDLQDKLLFHTIVDGIGCSWNRCNFCSSARCSVPFTPRPAEDIVAEMESMLKLGIAFFRFSSFETTVAHGQNIAEAILKSGLNVRYSMFARAQQPTTEIYEAYKKMIKSGLRAVFMGGETGHDRVNNEIMNKGVEKKNIIDTIAAIRLAADAVNLPCRIGLSLIYPCPVPAGITLDDVFQANTALIDDTLPDTVIVNPPGPMPATRWFDNADYFGFQFAQGSAGFANLMMQYEYSMYKPAQLWQDVGFTLQNKSCKDLLIETGRLRAYAADLGIPTDISDEYLMMTDAIGLSSKIELLEFKRKTLIDIVSGSTANTREFVAAINKASQQLAAANRRD
jgi:GNAT superfamily N-acetyltransferase